MPVSGGSGGIYGLLEGKKTTESRKEAETSGGKRILVEVLSFYRPSAGTLFLCQKVYGMSD